MTLGPRIELQRELTALKKSDECLRKDVAALRAQVARYKELLEQASKDEETAGRIIEENDELRADRDRWKDDRNKCAGKIAELKMDITTLRACVKRLKDERSSSVMCQLSMMPDDLTGRPSPKIEDLATALALLEDGHGVVMSTCLQLDNDDHKKEIARASAWTKKYHDFLDAQGEGQRTRSLRCDAGDTSTEGTTMDEVFEQQQREGE